MLGDSAEKDQETIKDTVFKFTWYKTSFVNVKWPHGVTGNVPSLLLRDVETGCWMIKAPSHL